jgi:hypothetical protein
MSPRYIAIAVAVIALVWQIEPDDVDIMGFDVVKPAPMITRGAYLPTSGTSVTFAASSTSAMGSLCYASQSGPSVAVSSVAGLGMGGMQ